ncbi:hypothetical protein M3172_15215 [Mesobacillus subterraneus]|uniref:hypothetical protein n=1 Tax=Mesobacillus subterraneus TaxID=285983 RepID=UPI00203C433A|nr:hypothetical protein [Mesobacillus subterraneus]MCM3574546.1 hypothetical protein [Mesobacillus subterraneus]
MTKTAKDPRSARTIRERMSDILYNLAFVVPIAIVGLLIGLISGGGGELFVKKGWNPMIISGFEILIDFLLIGLYLLLGIVSLKTLWFLFKERKAGRSYFSSKLNKVIEVVLIFVLLGGPGTLFLFLALSGLMTILL